MLGTFLKRLLLMALFLMLQVLVFNHVQILGYATPLICIYVILLFPLNTPRWQILLWGFTLGLLDDIFSNTPGMNAASLTLVAMLQPILLKIFGTKDFVENEDSPEPSGKTMNWSHFMRYVAVAVFINQVSFYLLEAFSFFNPMELAINIASGTVMSFLIILAIEGVRLGGKKKATT
jgi:hypothetical protein